MTSVLCERPLLTAAMLSGLGGAQAVATDNAQKYRDAASQMTASAPRQIVHTLRLPAPMKGSLMPKCLVAELVILKTACARARDQSMDIQRVASTGPQAKRQATEAALASAARPSQSSKPTLQAAEAPSSDSKPTETEPAPSMQRPRPPQEVSKPTADEQTAADARSSPAQKPALASTSMPMAEAPAALTAQAGENTVIDLNAPATDP